MLKLLFVLVVMLCGSYPAKGQTTTPYFSEVWRYAYLDNLNNYWCRIDTMDRDDIEVFSRNDQFMEVIGRDSYTNNNSPLKQDSLLAGRHWEVVYMYHDKELKQMNIVTYLDKLIYGIKFGYQKENLGLHFDLYNNMLDGATKVIYQGKLRMTGNFRFGVPVGEWRRLEHDFVSQDYLYEHIDYFSPIKICVITSITGNVEYHVDEIISDSLVTYQAKSMAHLNSRGYHLPSDSIAPGSLHCYSFLDGPAYITGMYGDTLSNKRNDKVPVRLTN